jgi:hypothetical protein
LPVGLAGEVITDHFAVGIDSILAADNQQSPRPVDEHALGKSRAAEHAVVNPT